MKKTQTNKKSFRIVSDDDCHDYIIPADKKKEWDEFISSGGWDVPKWAEELNGPISDIIFENYKIEE